MQFCWLLFFFPEVAAGPRGAGSARLSGAFPPGTRGPALSCSGRPGRSAAGAARRARGRGCLGRCFSPAFPSRCGLGGSMWRRPAWQVGPCEAVRARCPRGGGGSGPCAPPGGWSGSPDTEQRSGKGRGGQSPAPGALGRPCPLGRGPGAGSGLGEKECELWNHLLGEMRPFFQFLHVDL